MSCITYIFSDYNRFLCGTKLEILTEPHAKNFAKHYLTQKYCVIRHRPLQFPGTHTLFKNINRHQFLASPKTTKYTFIQKLLLLYIRQIYQTFRNK
ncbi:hypothetical protein OMAG_000414 [Candidatus Omnitrophus magneticus]|uniref:Uncharacterized protein n=1 Tax=Candidatus Omnitrophus magneticus TaxID=1609969 RepID=A0A0F0CUM8_9BACT|nr:hypothetical protein OMAG_000414 [Candidatus Omnitrophus magneticus]